MPGSIIADAPIWLQGLFVLVWGAGMVALLHIIREARYRRDPYSHDIMPIPTAHEGRRVPELVGHSSLATTPRYIEGSSDAKRRIVDLIS
jgi:hypothetical protein